MEYNACVDSRRRLKYLCATRPTIHQHTVFCTVTNAATADRVINADPSSVLTRIARTVEYTVAVRSASEKATFVLHYAQKVALLVAWVGRLADEAA